MATGSDGRSALRVDSAEARLLALHDQFCQGFADRRPDLVLEVVVDNAGLVVVTSEESLLRGIEALEAFLQRYVNGDTTYSWTWDQRDVVCSDDWGCLLAVGTETASSQTAEHQTPTG